MKKVYSKPLISVEAMTLDQPIANVNCEADRTDMQQLLNWNWFSLDRTCDKNILDGPEGKGGYYDYDGDRVADDESLYHDSICYHSNVAQAFLS